MTQSTPTRGIKSYGNYSRHSWKYNFGKFVLERVLLTTVSGHKEMSTLSILNSIYKKIFFQETPHSILEAKYLQNSITAFGVFKGVSAVPPRRGRRTP